MGLRCSHQKGLLCGKLQLSWGFYKLPPVFMSSFLCYIGQNRFSLSYNQEPCLRELQAGLVGKELDFKGNGLHSGRVGAEGGDNSAGMKVWDSHSLWYVETEQSQRTMGFKLPSGHSAWSSQHLSCCSKWVVCHPKPCFSEHTAAGPSLHPLFSKKSNTW